MEDVKKALKHNLQEIEESGIDEIFERSKSKKHVSWHVAVLTANVERLIEIDEKSGRVAHEQLKKALLTIQAFSPVIRDVQNEVALYER